MGKAFGMLNNLYFFMPISIELESQKASIRVKFLWDFVSRIAFWLEIPVLDTIFLWFRLRSTIKKPLELTNLNL